MSEVVHPVIIWARQFDLISVQKISSNGKNLHSLVDRIEATENQITNLVCKNIRRDLKNKKWSFLEKTPWNFHELLLHSTIEEEQTGSWYGPMKNFKYWGSFSQLIEIRKHHCLETKTKQKSRWIWTHDLARVRKHAQNVTASENPFLACCIHIEKHILHACNVYFPLLI